MHFRFFRFPVVVLVVALALVPISAVSATKVASGLSCKTVKQRVVYLNKVYTCTQVGKKKVWSKGIAVAKENPTPTQSSTPSEILPAKYPTAPTSFEDLVANYEEISFAAWRKSNEAIITATDLVPTFKAVTGPNTILAYKNPSSAFHLISRLYSGYKSSKNFTVLSFSFDDRDWAQSQMKLLQPNSNYQWITSFACATRSACWGGGVFTDESANGLLVLTTEILDQNHTSGTLEAHEYTHAVQQNQMRQPQPWPPTGNWPPTWFIEGQAVFSQNASMFHQSFDLYTKNRMAVSEGLFSNSSINSQWIQEFFVVNQPSTWFSKYESWRMYDLGGMLVEILTALKGPSSTMELWRLCGTGLNFEGSFEKVYGISFEKALPIISKAIALELGRT